MMMVHIWCFTLINLGCDTVAQFEQRVVTALAWFCQGNGLTVPDEQPTFRKRLRALLNQVLSRSPVLLIAEGDTTRIYLLLMSRISKQARCSYAAVCLGQKLFGSIPFGLLHQFNALA